MTETAVRLRFPAKAEYLLLARLVVGGVLRRLTYDERDVADLKLAVSEACGNAVRHAYPAGSPGGVEVELVPCGDRLELVVADTGAGIDLPVPETPPPPSEEGGMGLSIIRTVVDGLEIGRGPGGRGTVVHMTKLVGAAPVGAGDSRPGRAPDV
jgi:serine/threonine-protein kinase RsbW